MPKEKITIYAAGPDVFRPPKIIENIISKMTESAGSNIQVAFPTDEGYKGTKKEISNLIFRANKLRIDISDVVIANIQPFRGPNVDDGTASEIGYAYAKSKVIYGYRDISKFREDYKDICDCFDSEVLQIEEFPLIEDLGNPCNLMISEMIHESGGKIMNSFEECVKDVKEKIEEGLPLAQAL